MGEVTNDARQFHATLRTGHVRERRANHEQAFTQQISPGVPIFTTQQSHAIDLGLFSLKELTQHAGGTDLRKTHAATCSASMTFSARKTASAVG